MLAEAIAKIVSLAPNIGQLEVLRIPELPRKVFVRSPGGEVMEFEREPTPRHAKIDSLEDLIAALVDRAIAQDPEVYHTANAVIVLLDRTQRHEQICMPLFFSQRFSWLMGTDYRSGSPREIVKALQRGLGSSAPFPVVDAIRRVNFTRTNAGASVVEHGKESLGRSVEAVVQQADKIPERFVVRVPVYSNPGLQAFQAEVWMGLYLDLEGQAIEIWPEPDAIQAAIQTAQARLHEALVAAEFWPNPGSAPVFYGTP